MEGDPFLFVQKEGREMKLLIIQLPVKIREFPNYNLLAKYIGDTIREGRGRERNERASDFNVFTNGRGDHCRAKDDDEKGCEAAIPF